MRIAPFPIEKLDQIKNDLNDYKLLQRVPLSKEGYCDRLPIVLHQRQDNEKTHNIIILDTETTGLDYKSDKIIEIGMVKITYSWDRKIILSIDDIYDEFEDPHFPIPENITAITHITDQMVKDKSFDEDRINRMLSGAPLIVAHNAQFDRPFFEKRFPTLINYSWACSLNGINWYDLGFLANKLELLNLQCGYFYDAHRANVDCLALLWLLEINNDAFVNLIENAKQTSYILYAYNFPFDQKDELKALGYRFNGQLKCWYINLNSSEQLEKHKSILNNYYNVDEHVKIEKFNAKTRFKGK